MGETRLLKLRVAMAQTEQREETGPRGPLGTPVHCVGPCTNGFDGIQGQPTKLTNQVLLVLFHR